MDFLLTPADRPTVIEIDGVEQVNDPVDEERDALLKSVGVATIRLPAHSANRSVSQVVAGLVGSLDPATAWHPLVHGPAQMQRLAHACLEAVNRGFLGGKTWSIRLDDPTGLALVDFGRTLGLLLAVDMLWGARIMPGTVSVEMAGRSVTWTRVGNEYAESEPQRLPPDVAIHLELGLSPLHQLPSSESQPAVVIRDAPLPVQLTMGAGGEPARRVLPAATEGAHVTSALRTILQWVFAVEDFRDGQLQALMEVIHGRDCVVLLPTGAGKSLIYQLAGLVLPGRTLVVDPLVSLMEDQVRSLQEYGIDRVVAISAFTRMTGGLELALEQFRSGDALFVFIAPERLQQVDFRQSLRALAGMTPVNLAVIDEAHCVSEWGHDFRTAYLNVGRILRDYGRDVAGSAPPLLALTGTASRAVLKDVLHDLDIRQQSPHTLVKPATFDREELSFDVRRCRPDDMAATLQGVMQSMPAHFRQNPATFFEPSSRRPFPGLIFVPHANGAYGIDHVASVIQAITRHEVLTYSGSPPKGRDRRRWEGEKREATRAFMADQAAVMVSTKAFGMGIDKPNIRYVVHYGIPSSIESYYQESAEQAATATRRGAFFVVSEMDEQRNNRLLDDSTTLDELHRHVNGSRPRSSDDVDRQLFFFTNSFRGQQQELEAIERLLDDLEPLDESHTCTVAFGRDDEETERVLHRLSLLGVVRDYTVDWGSKRFEVTVRESTTSSAPDTLVAFIERSQPGRSAGLRERVGAASRGKVREAVEACAVVLTEFVYDTVALARRRSLREMLLAARESDTDGDFRRRILDYLQEGDVAPRLEALVDAPHFDLMAWLAEIADITSIEDAQEWRGGAARLLASYPEQPGLLLARGYSELVLPDGDREEGARNVAAALRSAVANYRASVDEIDRSVRVLVDRLLALGSPAAALGVALEAGGAISTDVRAAALADVRAAAPELPALAVIDLRDELTTMLQQLDSALVMEAHHG